MTVDPAHPMIGIAGCGVVGGTMLNAGRSAGLEAVGYEIRADRARYLADAGFRVSSRITALKDCAMVFVCVGTPELEDGVGDFDQVNRCLEDLARHLSTDSLVILRSTVLPDQVRLPGDLRVVANPEFLCATSPLADFLNPPFLVLGGGSSMDRRTVLDWYFRCGVPRRTRILECPFADALLLKYVCNWWHATKVEFANMVGEIAGIVGAEGSGVMEMMAKDSILNISASYLRPGEPFGGVCLPKDLHAGVAAFHDRAIIDLLTAVSKANRKRGGDLCP